MPDDPITSTNGFNEIYYEGTPNYVPRQIVSSPAIGTAGAPLPAPTSRTAAGIPVTSVSVVDQQTALAALQPQFDQVASLLDAKGQTMTLCTNLPPEIAARYVRQALPGESCWAFYKRMMSIVTQFPPVDVNNLNTTAQQLANHGNDILSDPFTSSTIPDGFSATGDYNGESGEQRLNNFDENPGESTLLLMLFIAIIRLTTSLIFNVAYTPMQGLLNKINDLYNIKQNQTSGLASIVPGGGFLAEAANAVVSGVSALLGALGAVGTALFFEAAKDAALTLIEGIIGGGPKLSTDVTRYDALITTSYIQQNAAYSSALNWPEAVLLYPQYLALQGQQGAIGNVYTYYGANSLANSRQGQQGISSESVMPSDLAQVMSMHQLQLSTILTRMEGILIQDAAETLLCCLIRLLGSMSTRWLQAAGAILQLSINRQASEFESLNAALSNLWFTIEKVVLSSILGILYNLFDEINSGIKSDLNAVLQSPLFQSNGCPPWNLFAQNMLQFIGGIEQSILDLVVSLSNSLNSQDQNNQAYTQGLNNSIYARQLLNLINAILNAQELGSLCANSTVPTDAELQALFDQVKTQFAPVTTNNTAVINTGNAAGSNSLTASNITTITSNTAALRSQYNQCLSKVTQQDVEQALAWIQALTGQTNG